LSNKINAPWYDILKLLARWLKKTLCSNMLANFGKPFLMLASFKILLAGSEERVFFPRKVKY